MRAKPGLNPHSLVGPIKEQIATLDRDQAVTEIATMEENIGDSLASRRLTMTLLGVFAGLALALASIGLLRRHGVNCQPTDARARHSFRARRQSR